MSVDVLTLYPQLTGPQLPGFSSCTKSCGCREESPCNDGRAPVHKLDVQSSLNIASVIWSYVHTYVASGRQVQVASYIVHHRSQGLCMMHVLSCVLTRLRPVTIQQLYLEVFPGFYLGISPGIKPHKLNSPLRIFPTGHFQGHIFRDISSIHHLEISSVARDLYIAKNQKLCQNQNSKLRNFAMAVILNLISITDTT